MKKSDKIGIVLGGGISKENRIPYDSKTRIKKALKLLKKNKIHRLILSGKCFYLYSIIYLYLRLHGY